MPADEIRRAREGGLVGLLAVAAAARPGPGTYTPDELADKVGMERDLSKRFWRAMGFPDVPDDERVFNDVDADALSTVQAMLTLGFTNVDVAIHWKPVA